MTLACVEMTHKVNLPKYEFFIYPFTMSTYLPSDRNFIDPVHLNASDYQGLPGLAKYPFKFTV